jgi:hypothetical protein
LLSQKLKFWESLNPYRLTPALYPQAAVFGKRYDDFGLLHPAGQDLGGFGLHASLIYSFHGNKSKILWKPFQN